MTTLEMPAGETSIGEMPTLEMPEGARTRVDRISVFELRDSVVRGAVVVDIRPQSTRAVEGTFPGALAIEHDVLERRLNPTSDARLALATDYTVEFVIVCSEEYTSRQAAASLQELGLINAAYLVGGYQALRSAGLLGVLAKATHCVREAEAVTAH